MASHVHRGESEGNMLGISQGVSHEASTGRTDSGESKSSNPKFRFLLEFRPLYFGNIGKPKKFGKYSENFLENRDFGGTSPKILNQGNVSPPPSVHPVATLMAFRQKNGGTTGGSF